MKRIIGIILAVMLFAGCDRQEFDGYDTPFLSIAASTGASSMVVLSNVNNINTFLVTLSSRMLDKPLTVNYEIAVGDGLQEGVDYELLTQGNSLTFEPGVFDMPIRIKWISHPVDDQKDNTLTIKLLSNDQNIHIGRPGPDCLLKSLVIEKKNE